MIQRKVAAHTQDHFLQLLPRNQVWFTPKEVAGIIGRSDQYVRDCFESQELMGHRLNGRGRKGEGSKPRYQIHRDCLMLYLLETANYEPEDYLDRLCELIGHRSVDQLNQIGEAVRDYTARAHKRATFQ